VTAHTSLSPAGSLTPRVRKSFCAEGDSVPKREYRPQFLPFRCKHTSGVRYETDDKGANAHFWTPESTSRDKTAK
jgi:hypothetical protein